MLECVPNVSEGRDRAVIAALAESCGASLLDVHADADHHRSVFTLAGPDAKGAEVAARDLVAAIAERVDVRNHVGVHPRLGALDVVPFVALEGARRADATVAARAFASWVGRELSLPAFLYGDADDSGRPLPAVRENAFTRRPPDYGPTGPHPRLGAVAVGARPPLVAVNCWLDRDDLALAREIAAQVRERDGGLPGVRALGFALASRGRVQVSMNLTRLEASGLERACTAVRRLAHEAEAEVEEVELVGLVPASELQRCSPEFLAWARVDHDQTIEARLARRSPS
jgi:glutamate formiminotransferase